MIRRNKKKDEKKNKPVDRSKEIVVASSIFQPGPLEKGVMVKHSAGRPTVYQESYCRLIKILMAEGKSLATAAVELGITYRTLRMWVDSDPENKHFKEEFAWAVKEGEFLSKRWWEENARLNLHNKNFNATLWMMNMSNRFGYSRKIEGNIVTENIETEKKVLELKVDRTDEYTAELLGILVKAGAIGTPIKRINQDKTD